MNDYLCGVTLSSTIKGDIKKVGFYDVNKKIHYKINVIKSKKIFNFNKNKYYINVNNFLNSELNSFESNYVFIFPIRSDMFLKIKDCRELDSLNYKKIAKSFGLEEWLV